MARAKRLALAGNHPAAAVLYREWLRSHDNDEAAWLDLARSEHASLGATAAEATLNCWLARAPRSADAWFQLAALLEESPRRRRDAEAAYRRAIELRPQHGPSFGGLGRILLLTEQPQKAAAALAQAANINPENADFACNLGIALQMSEDYSHAAQAFAKALALEPKHAVTHLNAGRLMRSLDRHEAALAHFELAAHSVPPPAGTNLDYGAELLELGRIAEARRHLARAVLSEPRNPDLLAALARTEHFSGDLIAARQHYEQAFHACDNAALLIRAALLTPPVATDTDAIDVARKQMLGEFAALREREIAISEPQLLRYPETGFYLAYHGRNDRELLQSLDGLFREATPTLGYVAPHATAPEPATGPLRIGFVSRFLGDHSVGRFFGPIIQNLSGRTGIQIVVFPIGAHVDASVAQWCGDAQIDVIPLRTLHEARKIVAGRQLDVLVYPEIGMDPFTYLLSFSRLARVQCVLQGHSTTTGVAAIDWYVSSDLVEPPDGENWYSEKLHRLPTLPMYLEPPSISDGPLADRQALGLPPGRIYLCAMKLQKVHPDMDSAFAQILERDPEAQLVFVDDDRYQTWKPQLEARFRRHIPTARERIRFIPWIADRTRFLQTLRAADIVIDTFHHGGATTSHLCVASGIPVVTLPGASSRGRFLLAYYRLLGIADCIADSPYEYVELAIRLATDRELHRSISQRLVEHRDRLYNNSAMFDAYADFLTRVASTPRTTSDLGPAYWHLNGGIAWATGGGHPIHRFAPDPPTELFPTAIAGVPRDTWRTTVESPSKYAIEIRDAVVVSNESAVLSRPDHHAIWDLAVSSGAERYALRSDFFYHRIGNRILLDLALAKPCHERVPNAINLSGRASGNYYHWLFEFLPRLAILDQLPDYADWPLLIDAGLHPNIHESLRLAAPGRRLIELPNNSRVDVGRLLHIAPLCRMPIDFADGAIPQPEDIVFSKSAIDFLRSRVAGNRFSPKPGPRKIYLTRRNARYRQLLNQAEIEQYFVARGFEIVDPDTLTLAQQIDLMATAGVVAGETGAAMANMVFAAPGTRWMVLYYAGAPFEYFSHLAQSAGIDLVYTLGQSVAGTNPIAYQCDYEVDCARIEDGLRALAIDSVRSGARAERSPAGESPRHLAFLIHTPELVNHYRPIWKLLDRDQIEVVTWGEEKDQLRVATLAARENIRAVRADDRLAGGQQYRWMVSNHPVSLGDHPLISRLAERNVRLMYALGKEAWNLRDWNALYDVILCFGPYHANQLARVTNAKIVQVGYPRFDSFFDSNFDKGATLARFSCKPERQTVVWLPTWQSLSSVGHFDDAMENLCDRYNVVIKVHPLMSDSEPEKVASLAAREFTCVITDTTDNVALYQIADFVVCDYGGPPFGAIYTDRNLLLLNVANAGDNELTGQSSPDVLLRQDIVNIDAKDSGAVRTILGDSQYWHSQREVRRRLREQYFAPNYGNASVVAASQLTELALAFAEVK